MIKKMFTNRHFLKLGDFISRQRVIRYYEFFSETQWWPREKLVRYQDDKIHQLVLTAYKEVPFYHKLYKESMITPNSINSIQDLKELPIISKQELKRAYPEGCTRKNGWPMKEYFTSGSTGNPFAVMVDNLTMSEARALMLLRANYGGWSIGDPILQTGMTLRRGTVKELKDLLLGVTYVSAFDLTDENLERYINLIEKKSINYVMGYPGSIYALAVRAGQRGGDLSLKGVITWGDNLYDQFRRTIENQFRCRVTDTYGCGEGIQVAAQCPDGYGGYHIFMPHVVLEIVDERGKPVERGERGNILLTRLEPGAMPLIRYKVGDLGRMSVEENCPCGRGFELLERIEGRESDIIHTPNGNKLIVHFFTGIFEYYPEIKQFCVVQNQIKEIEIQIVKQTKIEKNKLEEIEKEIKSKGDKSLTIKFNFVDNIDCKNGKRRFVISNLEKNKNIFQ